MRTIEPASTADHRPGCRLRVVVLAILSLCPAIGANAHLLPATRGVSIDSLRATVEAMQNLGTRFSGTRSADSAAAYMAAKLASMGYPVEIDTVRYLSGTPKITFNIIATKPGGSLPDERIVLGAHFDSISRLSYGDSLSPAPGADDNASGCAALLEAARILKNFHFSRSIDFVFFGGEEVGRRGSTKYARQARERNEKIVAMLSLDTIGYDEGPVWDVGIYQNHASDTLAQTCELGIRETGKELVPIRINNPFWARSDHYSFWEQGYTAVHIFEGEGDSNPNTHGIQDSIANINFPYLAAITRSVITIASMIGTSEESGRTLTLGRAFPNPSASSTSIAYTLHARTFLSVDIYDVLGRHVENLFRGYGYPGYHELEWSGRKGGRSVPSGIYFVNFSTPSTRETKKIIILR